MYRHTSRLDKLFIEMYSLFFSLLSILKKKSQIASLQLTAEIQVFLWFKNAITITNQLVDSFYIFISSNLSSTLNHNSTTFNQ